MPAGADPEGTGQILAAGREPRAWRGRSRAGRAEPRRRREAVNRRRRSRLTDDGRTGCGSPLPGHGTLQSAGPRRGPQARDPSGRRLPGAQALRREPPPDAEPSGARNRRGAAPRREVSPGRWIPGASPPSRAREGRAREGRAREPSGREPQPPKQEAARRRPAPPTGRARRDRLAVAGDLGPLIDVPRNKTTRGGPTGGRSRTQWSSREPAGSETGWPTARQPRTAGSGVRGCGAARCLHSRLRASLGTGGHRPRNGLAVPPRPRPHPHH